MLNVRSFGLRSLPMQFGSMQEVAVRVVDHARHGHHTRLVIPVNGQVFIAAHDNPVFAEVIGRAEEVIPDGASVSMGMRLLGRRLVHRVPGVDLLTTICEEANRHGLRVMLLGGRPGAAEKTTELLNKSMPNLDFATLCPPMGFERSADELANVCNTIREFAPHIVFVAFGAPKQEFFMDEHLRALDVPIAMAVGGSFEMISGMVQRAPKWMRAIGMEWFFRLLLEPRRLFKRYLYTNSAFLWVLATELIGLRQPILAQPSLPDHGIDEVTE